MRVEAAHNHHGRAAPFKSFRRGRGRIVSERIERRGEREQAIAVSTDCFEDKRASFFASRGSLALTLLLVIEIEIEIEGEVEDKDVEFARPVRLGF